MTSDLDDRIRASLRRRAEGISVEVPDPTTARAVRRPTRNRRLELTAVAAALVLFVAAGALVILMARHDRATPVVSGETGPPVPEVGPLGRIIEPGALVTMPAAWTLERFSFHSAAYLQKGQSPGALQGTADGRLVPVVASNAVEYQFSDGGRTMQLDFYPLGVREPLISTPGLPLVRVRNSTGYAFDHGGGRYRVQWDEGGRTWEADGAGYASLDAFVSVLATIEWQDDTAWASHSPSGLAQAVRDYPDGAVVWGHGADPELQING